MLWQYIMGTKHWIRNASNLLVVDAIFAALAGILLVYVFQDFDLKQNWIIPTSCFILSFLLFAWAAEQMTTAVDESDVKKYLYILIFYNIAVISLFVGVASIIHFKFSIKVWILIFGVIPLWRPWIKDLFFLLFQRDEYYDYLAELEGMKKPEEDHSFLMKLFYKTKVKTYPHENVYTRLKCSEIHGIGVFAIRDIPKGTKIFSNDVQDMIWIRKDELSNLDLEAEKLYKDFCVFKNNKLGCPKNFNSLTVGWYINESKENPNVGCTKNYDFIALRLIKTGEELFTDYSTFSDQ